jgi:NADPH2:quinone reductase
MVKGGMPKAIIVEEIGGPDRLRLVEMNVGEPASDEIRVRQRAVGLNFIDVYHRTGQYAVPALPFVPGMEAAGIVEAVGSEVTDFHVGDRVTYLVTLGAYAEVRVLAAAKAVLLPDAISDEQAAGMMLKGLTAQYLLRQTLPFQRGDRVLFHAGAGGVGRIACQWARHLGIEVIATAGGPEKCAQAQAAGASHVIDYRAEDFVAGVRTITGGIGVKAVFDGVGVDTFARSLDCLRPFGMLVSFGQSSGPIPPFNIATLSAKGSLYLTRPTISTYIADRDRYLAMTRELFDVVGSGAVKVDVRQRYPLAEAARAHWELESRLTTGSSVLIP